MDYLVVGDSITTPIFIAVYFYPRLASADSLLDQRVHPDQRGSLRGVDNGYRWIMIRTKPHCAVRNDLPMLPQAEALGPCVK